MSEETIKLLREEIKRLTEESRVLRDGIHDLYNATRALHTLYAYSQEVRPDTDVLELLGRILDASLAVIKATDGTLMLRDDANGDLVFMVVRGTQAARLVGYRLPKGKGIASWVAEHRQPQIILDVHSDTRFWSQVDQWLGYQTRSMICVPIMDEHEHVLGVLEVLNKVSDREFNQDDLHLMLIVAQLAGIALHRVEQMAAAPQTNQAPNATPRASI